MRREILLMVTTGPRISEVKKLAPKQIQFGRNSMRFLGKAEIRIAGSRPVDDPADLGGASPE